MAFAAMEHAAQWSSGQSERTETFCTRLLTVKGILNTAMTFIFSYVGWWLGAKISIFTAFILATIFTGIGLWFSIKITKYYLP